ncbi:MAG TPA: tRNA 2-selenouridine(34) synthase MnmH [Burkholderiales bacterium]|nr:tRNA 2-selenouridine(34) synthase MnmH [Burkholderiales bacterium]
MDVKRANTVTVAQLDAFDEVIDVRSPGEFALDHVPGALNCPVLDDEERARVGTMYKQASPFDAKKQGAALVSRNIARHIEERFRGRGRDWRPLVCCWRGGQRSASMAHVLREIGWAAATLEGGYRAYRRHVLGQLEELPSNFRWRVLCGETGSGKSRLLQALAARGAQALDLERLARHRGSLLGDLPGEPQPAQKMFDSLVWHALREFDPSRPVYVEAESKKIGQLQLPDRLLERMRAGECVRLAVPAAERVRFLIEEYRHFLAEPAGLKAKLTGLTAHYGHTVIGRWLSQADAGAWHDLVSDLLHTHYDPSYLRATTRNYLHYDSGRQLPLERLDEAGIESAAADLSRSPVCSGGDRESETGCSSGSFSTPNRPR